MLLPKFDYGEPKSTVEACQMMAEYGPAVKVLAGGTDLLVDMKKKLLSPTQLVSISRIEEMKAIDVASDGITIGSCVSVARIAASDVIARRWPALCSGAAAIGSPQIRNLATIGGNIVSASAAADLPPSLIAHDARLVLERVSGKRVVSLDRFFLGARQTDIAVDEILTQIKIKAPPPCSGGAYINLGIRSCQDIKIVNVATFLALDRPDGVVTDARIAMGCVGPFCLHAASAEQLLVGEKPSISLFRQAGEAAMGDCAPRGSATSRASAEYKRDMIGALTLKTLERAWKQAIGRDADSAA